MAMVDGTISHDHQPSAISHDMTRLSVNVNKVATLRNSRGGREPNVIEAVEVCIAAGAPGITVHPRADRRHITPDDVRAIAGTVRSHPGIEYNMKAIRGPSCSISSKRCRPINARSCPWCQARSPARRAGSRDARPNICRWPSGACTRQESG
jgi:Pyridoxal phosphate biosynthesis protein